MERAFSALSILAMSCNNVLFLIRVCAVYGNSRTVIAVILIPFFVVLGTSLAMPFGLVAGHLGPNSKCIELTFRPWIASVPLSNAVNSTLVFLVISYRIASQDMYTRGQSWRSALRCFFTGDGAPHVGRVCYGTGSCATLRESRAREGGWAESREEVASETAVDPKKAEADLMTAEERETGAVSWGVYANWQHPLLDSAERTRFCTSRLHGYVCISRRGIGRIRVLVQFRFCDESIRKADHGLDTRVWKIVHIT
ncbi:hypothetical protein FIBSPDRAFT_884429 [Athelia psychrophila]|uniref:Uncharacterized protein n=1 Tax=Athelia psychrophila TaxID=1759441 RepID=A0A166T3X1_9AGAM|nr:hypothetical protein FIBSPDRAFT_884429 [Fibularhizoctonia sp. CBS 109695]